MSIDAGVGLSLTASQLPTVLTAKLSENQQPNSGTGISTGSRLTVRRPLTPIFPGGYWHSRTLLTYTPGTPNHPARDRKSIRQKLTP